MQRVLSAGLGLLVFVCAGEAARADGPHGTRGYYVELGGGIGWYTDSTWAFLDFGTLFDVEFDSGAVYRIALGMKLPYSLRGEMEAAFRSNDGEKCHQCGGVIMGGTVHATSVMANLYYDFKVGGVSPFIGAGIGWAHLNLDTTLGNGAFAMAMGTDDRFAYQLMAGVAVPLSERMGLTVRYTYFDIVGDRMTVFNTGVPGLTPIEASYSNHSLTVGLRIDF